VDDIANPPRVEAIVVTPEGVQTIDSKSELQAAIDSIVADYPAGIPGE
jgi:hypothetical protein